ncbi:23S rRNA (guanosine(2251)-2'-O)-methyltransferase RlmB [Fusibacter bizertensis]|uniref:23S rRNA (Guanosine(2251)-2'-O)-methyltransferase RlmB n=1 Tax=Fusibacter bizertensis TaxID=1488331 RepID=A0ABT6NHH1_9FIRM|nr:23S rRNA (guanosine(2251)-2'-O)-methyltransferase RlmB [Fusibacter bizertensis]MDH8679882.1 23S rRNA (guanosine(2251)-2'-O)-methyltransferase RlmB [Fusibacter bizertensis]
MEDIIYGRNPILEAVNAGHEINKLLVLEGSKDKNLQKVINAAREKQILIQFVERKLMDKISEGENHQGVIAYVSPYHYYEVEELLQFAKDKNEDPLLIICDEITDPHNLGSIIRTANAVGAHGVIIPKRRSAAINQTVVKTSCGAVEYVPVARVTNITQTIKQLKTLGVWVIGTDMDAPLYYDANLTGSVALVIGNEGDGISRLVKESCDLMVSLPMMGQVSSLNAAVAGSIVMYEVIRQRNIKK